MICDFELLFSDVRQHKASNKNAKGIELVPVSKIILYCLTAKKISMPRCYGCNGLSYSWCPSRLGGKFQEYLLEMAQEAIPTGEGPTQGHF